MTYKAILAFRRQLVVFAIAMVAYQLLFSWTIDTATSNPLALLTLGGPAYYVVTLAIVCGVNLSLERSETGRSSLLFPISRARMALTTFAVDGFGLAIAYAIACVLTLGASLLIHGSAFTLRGGGFVQCVVLPLAAIAAFYGFVALVSVAVGRGRYTALIVPIVCILLFMATATDVPGHQNFAWLNIVNPLLYLGLASEIVLGRVHSLDIYSKLTLEDIAAILGAIALVSLTLATILFRRART